MTKEDYIVKFEEKHKTKFFGEFPIDFNLNTSNIVIFCEAHGRVENSARNILYNGFYCKYCSKESRAQKNITRILTDIKKPDSYYIDKCNKKHNFLYEYPSEIKNRRIDIICKKHGLFNIFVHSHLKGTGCQKCKLEEKEFKNEQSKLNKLKPRDYSNQILHNKSRITPVEIVKKQFQDKFQNAFEYDWTTYVNLNTPMKMICSIHGEFNKTPTYHLGSKYGCNRCSKSRTSSSENDWLDSKNITTRQYKIYKDNKFFIKVDGYDEKTNTIYEYLGDYWHGNPKYFKNKKYTTNKNTKIHYLELLQQTEDRFNFLLQKGYTICYIWEREHIERIFNGKLEY